MATRADETSADSLEAEEVEQIVITGREVGPREPFAIDPRAANPNGPDTASLVNLIPGAHVVPNGPITGEVQIRGLWGARADIKVGDIPIDPAGPNRMDPPLAYAPGSLLRSLDVSRGIAPVSAGPETLGGAVSAELKGIEYAKPGDRDLTIDAEVGGRSADASFLGGGLVGLASERHKLDLLASHDFGNDRRSPEGRVRNSEYERTVYGGAYGFRVSDDHELGLQFRHTDIDDTGTAALPMDIRFFDTEMLRAEYSGSVGEVNIHTSAYYVDIDHRMDNFGLRRAPAAGLQRFIKAEGKAYGWDLSATYPVGIGNMEVGTDGVRTLHNMDVGNPTNPVFFVDNFDDAKRDRYGIYAEWTAAPIDGVEVEAGLRYTRVNMDADPVDSLPSQLMLPPMLLRNGFNRANRDQSDDHFDFALRSSYEAAEGLLFDVGVARKTRSPSYIERYAWLPLEVTSGLADGNNYVGDIGLDEEISYQVEAGVSWHWGFFYFAPRAFYHHIDDFIQGVPTMDPNVLAVSAANGDLTPLQFQNVEAELFGADAEFAIELPWNLRIDGLISYVRGKRKDIRDDLFRIAPLSGRTTFSYLGKGWSISVEGVYQGKQRHVSVTNGESRSPSHAVMNVFASWEVTEQLRLMLGVDNVTDNLYRPHLAGFNRVANSATALGRRLPGTGVNAFGRVGYRF